MDSTAAAVFFPLLLWIIRFNFYGWERKCGRQKKYSSGGGTGGGAREREEEGSRREEKKGGGGGSREPARSSHVGGGVEGLRLSIL